MDILFLSFANSVEHPLLTLKEEDERVYNSLSRRMAQQHFTVHRDSSATTDKILEYITRFRDGLVLFSYSGHAGRDRLLLEDDPANSTGIAAMLGTCPRLKLVLLNGCSTAGQVEQLLNHKIPCVIATSAPVEDRSATEFSIRFFQVLSEQYGTIDEAFQVALGAAQTVSKRALAGNKMAEGEFRDVVFSMEGGQPVGPFWGIYYKEAAKESLHWRLPMPSEVDGGDTYEPNEQLVSILMEALGPYLADIAQMNEEELYGAEKSILDKREAILKAFPHPVSEQIRKLMVPQVGGIGQATYDKPGKARLEQLLATYRTSMELIGFIVLAQLWEALHEQGNLRLPAETRRELSRFFQTGDAERNDYDFLVLIRILLRTFEEKSLPCFAEELRQIGPELAEGSELYNACRFMELQRKRPISSFDPEEAGKLSRAGEKMLGVILGKFSFLANYTLASVKDIDVVKYRHLRSPKYKHRLVKLVQRFVGLAEEQELKEEFMDTSSVLLMRKEQHRKGFLNLTPFIIDENAFNERASLAKLYFFDRYEKGTDTYFFRHVYKPQDEKLAIGSQKPFLIVKAQFNALSGLLFQQPMQKLTDH
ncbi:MAG: hypothetical protein H6558_22010 [Lewinellaceae bacterium]|nr:hypothetical protein [Lewinellaceae bacterium]